MKRWLTILAGVLVSAGAMYLAIKDTNIANLGDELRRGRYIYVIPAFGLVFLGLYLRGLRWKVLLNDKITPDHSFSIANIGYFMNSLLPLRLGEIARCYLVTRLKPPVSMFTALSSVVVERVLDLLTVVVMLVIGASALTLSADQQFVAVSIRTGGILSVVATLVLVIFALRPDFAHRILDVVLKLLPFLEKLNLRHVADRVLDGFASLGSVGSVARLMLWNALAWGTSAAAAYVLMFVFYDQPTWQAAVLSISFASVAIAIPAAPGGIGAYEFAVVLGMTVGGMVTADQPQGRAFTTSLLTHLVTVGSYAFLGVVGIAQEGTTLGEILNVARRQQQEQKEHGQEHQKEMTPSQQPRTPLS